MKHQKFSTVIKILEDKLNLKLSNEQINILKNQQTNPVLINACAGSGKTTILLLNILMKIMNGEKPQNILAITFSKKAQLEMENRFNSYTKKLGITINNKPTFNTFDAFFYHLLKKVESNIKVLPNNGPEYFQVQFAMQNAIKHQPKMVTQKDLLNKIDEFYNYLINNNYTRDGINIIQKNEKKQTLEDLGNKLKIDSKQEFYENYRSVITAYINAKKEQKFVDFTDMKLKLYKHLGNTEDKKIIQQSAEHYNITFIDEFQDINNLQWTLLNQILSKKALQNLNVIGDDDQSIYTFRGSNPKIIMEFQKKLPKTTVFKLTTNYRTAPNILNSTKPIIEKNQYRLRKPLNSMSEPKDDGIINEFRSSDFEDSDKILLNEISHKLRNNTINNHDIAIICRNNVDIAIASDYLAQKHLYTNVNRKSNILQNNPIYKTIIKLMYCMKNNNLKQFQSQCNKLGFNAYVQHVNNIINTKLNPNQATLLNYGQAAEEYNNSNLETTNKNKKFHEQLDDAVYDLVKDLQENNDDNEHEANMTFCQIKNMTKTYYEYMCKKGFVDTNIFQNIIRCLERNTDSTHSLNDFFEQENTKFKQLQRAMAEPNKEFQANFLTIHQSKGLEFKYVYIYNMRPNRINSEDIEMNKEFAPQLSKKEFFNKLNNNDWHEFKNSKTYNWLYQESIEIKDVVHSLSKKNELIKDLVNHTNKIINKKILTNFTNAYEQIIHNSKHVEDERRLIYVGLTRSIHYAAFNNDPSGFTPTSPLLKELNINNEDVLTYNQNNKLINYQKLFQNKEYSLDDLETFQKYFN